MPTYKNKKLGCSFTLPDDITQRQMEIYEGAARAVLDGVENPTDSILYRAALTGVIEAKVLQDATGLPEKVDDIPGTNSRVNIWAAQNIAEWLVELKTIDPNS
jgi:hypothetical protein